MGLRLARARLPVVVRVMVGVMAGAGEHVGGARLVLEQRALSEVLPRAHLVRVRVKVRVRRKVRVRARVRVRVRDRARVRTRGRGRVRFCAHQLD